MSYSAPDFELAIGATENVWLPLDDLDLTDYQSIDLTQSLIKIVYKTESGAKRLLVKAVPSFATGPTGQNCLQATITVPSNIGRLIDETGNELIISCIFDLYVSAYKDIGQTIPDPTKNSRIKVQKAVRVFRPESERDIEYAPILVVPITQTAISLFIRHDRVIYKNRFDTSSLDIKLYSDNDLVVQETVAGPLSSIVERDGKYYRWTLSSPDVIAALSQLPPRLVPYQIMLDLTGTAPISMGTTGIWVITPSIYAALTELRMALQKSRLQNVIRALDYTDNDLLFYLQQGLALFNSFPPAITSFTGLNMQNAIRTHWIYASQIYAMMAQYMAENDLNFDLSGQQVSLNIDRKSGIDSTLSRLQDMLNSNLRPFKQLLVKSGVTGGDGNSSGQSSGRSIGTVSVGNHPLLNPAYWSPANTTQRIRRIYGL